MNKKTHPELVQLNLRVPREVKRGVKTASTGLDLSLEQFATEIFRSYFGARDTGSDAMRAAAIRLAGDIVAGAVPPPPSLPKQGTASFILPLHSPNVQGITVDSDKIRHALQTRHSLHAPSKTGGSASPL